MQLKPCKAHENLSAPAITAMEWAGRSPYDGWHHLYAIPTLIQQLGHADWLAQIMLFLSHYDGIEEFMQPEDQQPVVFTKLLLMAELMQQTERGPGSKHRIAHALSHADFASYGASWVGSWSAPRHLPEPPRIVWRPLEQPFLDFLRDAPTATHTYSQLPDVFKGSRFAVEPQDIERFLLG